MIGPGTIAELKAVGRRLDAAKAQMNDLAVEVAGQGGPKSSPAMDGRWQRIWDECEAASTEYRRLLEDVTEQHADVIRARLT